MTVDSNKNHRIKNTDFYKYDVPGSYNPRLYTY